MLLIFDENEDLQLVLDNCSDEGLPYFNAIHIERINADNTLSFDVPTEHPDSNQITEGHYVALKDKEGDWLFFEIMRVEETHDIDKVKNAYCENVSNELLDEFITLKRFIDRDASYILDELLVGTRWVRGTSDLTDLLPSFTSTRNSVLSAIEQLRQRYNADLKFYVELTGNTISARKIDIVSRRGTDTDLRFEYNYNIQSIKRTVDSTELKTALFGYGRAIEDDDGTKTRTNFSDVLWQTPSDPANKPVDQEYIEDPTAKSLYGRAGGTRNRFGKAEFDTEDSAELIQLTWDYLQTINKPKLTYESKIVDLSILLGNFDFTPLLGDTINILDSTFNPPLAVSARVIENKRYLNEPEKDEVILGNFRELVTDNYKDTLDLTNNVNESDFAVPTQIVSEYRDLTVGQLFASNLVGKSPGQSIYVNSSTGSDDLGDGTSGNPYLTLSFALSRIDKFLLERVDIFATGTFLENPLVVTGFQGPGPLIFNLGTSTINGGLFVINNTAFIRFDGISPSSRALIDVQTDQHEGARGYCNSLVLMRWIKIDSQYYKPYAFLGQFGFYHFEECSFVGATLACLTANTATMWVDDCVGGDAPYGMRAANAGYIGHLNLGMVPQGTTGTYDVEPDSTIKPMNGVPTYDSSGGAGPTTATAIYNVIDTVSYRYGFRRTDWVTNKRIYEGEWLGNGNHTGIMIFGTQFNALVGKTIISAELTIKRYNGGGSSTPQWVRFYGITNTTAPATTPTLGTNYGNLIQLSWNETGIVNMPSTFLSQVSAGTVKGLAIFQSTGSPYVLLEGYDTFTTSIKFIYQP